MNGSEATSEAKPPLASGGVSNGDSVGSKKRKKDGLAPIMTHSPEPVDKTGFYEQETKRGDLQHTTNSFEIHQADGVAVRLPRGKTWVSQPKCAARYDKRAEQGSNTRAADRMADE
ncbi:hypothetical protein NLG97_g10626 [Lecanicillium saksenae]|uniref:Uncharacterized protein n=1 Tax=Lecanicillium saksenae TaxID=468837 RepID=A0ACC1QEH0_9HYPO|nr:hypothetical protein NLG97_g10626 [Lecanicillium saksenae]